jgi:TatD DNase family protein
MNALTDTHAHLGYIYKDAAAAATLSSATAPAELANFGFILDIGTDPGDLGQRISLFNKWNTDALKLRFSGGIWPYKWAAAAVQENIAILSAQLEAAPDGTLAAIGECGYDRRENPDSTDGETELLEAQLELARRYNLPVIIHSRERPCETAQTLARAPDVRGIIHCFSYTNNEAKTFLDMGYYISFAGNLTFKNAQNLRDAISIVPRDRLLLETDAPFLAPVPHRGKPCRPDMIIETYKCAASILNIDIEELKSIVASNAARIFKL